MINRRIQNLAKDQRSKVSEKYLELLIIFKTRSLNLVERPEYMSDFKYIKILNTPGLLICQGFKFPELHRIYLFS